MMLVIKVKEIFYIHHVSYLSSFAIDLNSGIYIRFIFFSNPYYDVVYLYTNVHVRFYALYLIDKV